MTLPFCVALAGIVEALFFLSTAYWFAGSFLHAHATPAQVIVAIWPTVLKALLLVLASWLYWRKSDLRPFLGILALLGAVFGVLTFLSMAPQVASWNFFDGDLLVQGAYASLVLVLLGILAAADLALTYTRRRPRSI